MRRTPPERAPAIRVTQADGTASWAEPLQVGRAAVYAGTCSWADAHFVKEGGFYPRPVADRPAARLRFYATVFPTVEIDATYYALLDPEMADRWIQWTPPGFVFHVKAFGLFTGHGVDPRRLPAEIQRLLPAEAVAARQVSFREVPRQAEEACWEHFTEFARRLHEAGRLGYILCQFPRWYLPSPGLFRRLGQIRGLLPGYRVAVEFRHRAWVERKHREALEQALREHNLIYVIPDEPELPWTVPPEVIVTSDWSVVRFHGRNATAWSRRGASTHEVYDYLYSQDELEPWARKAREIAGQVDRLYLMFNNHYRGSSARNARMMLELLAAQGATAGREENSEAGVEGARGRRDPEVDVETRRPDGGP
jgi:uncharacterized protein YecE (DUF72 family)